MLDGDPAPVDFGARLDAVAAALEPELDALIGQTNDDRLRDAMRYAVLGGGKRLRPFLVVETAGLFDVSEKRALRAGAALECIHVYSLVHDDLPAMDDDDLRRGKPTAHKAFDEATAILAGDALQTLAFETLSDPATDPDPAMRAELVLGLARAAGMDGMAGGQMRDLQAETSPLDLDQTLAMQAMKTGALFRFACEAGAILGRADGRAREALDAYARAIGAAFQIADDLLDRTADASTLGKAAGKDAARGKATLVDLLGEEQARARLDDLVRSAERSIAMFGNRAATLAALARFIRDREK